MKSTVELQNSISHGAYRIVGFISIAVDVAGGCLKGFIASKRSLEENILKLGFTNEVSVSGTATTRV